MFSLVSRKFLGMRNIALYSVCKTGIERQTRVHKKAIFLQKGFHPNLETLERQYYFTSAGANVIPVGQGITAKFPKKPNARTKLTTTKVSKTFKIRRGSCNILFRLGDFKSTIVYSRAASIFKFYRFTTNQVFLSTTLSMKFLIQFS